MGGIRAALDRNYCRGGTLYSVRDALGVAKFLPALEEVSAIDTL
jgi:hypothetical protein